MSFCAVNDTKTKRMQVIWDLGRYCNYNCSYCPPHRSNNWSATANLKELIQVSKSLERYNNIYNQYRRIPFDMSCSFTGGEPTANPVFFDFLEYMKDNLPYIHRTVTTNGFYNYKKLQKIINCTDYTTISYHCEASIKQKETVKDNIKAMKDFNYPFKVNVMFHKQDNYFKECIDLCNYFDSIKIDYIPRVIGDSNIKEKINSKTVHVYTKEQIEWLSNFWLTLNTDLTDKNINQSININKHNKNIDKDIVGLSMGRPCCGGRALNILDDTEWKISNFVPNTNFCNWSCMINWYFLYINQEIDYIYHGQTCQINFEGNMGPICKATEFDKYCNTLEKKFNEGSINYIRCPKKYCGCGLCAPKAKEDEKALELFNSHVHNIKPRFIKKKVFLYENSIQEKIELIDKEN